MYYSKTGKVFSMSNMYVNTIMAIMIITIMAGGVSTDSYNSKLKTYSVNPFTNSCGIDQPYFIHICMESFIMLEKTFVTTSYTTFFLCRYNLTIQGGLLEHNNVLKKFKYFHHRWDNEVCAGVHSTHSGSACVHYSDTMTDYQLAC